MALAKVKPVPGTGPLQLPSMIGQKEEGRILIINYSFLVFELNRSLRSPKDH